MASGYESDMLCLQGRAQVLLDAQLTGPDDSFYLSA